MSPTSIRHDLARPGAGGGRRRLVARPGGRVFPHLTRLLTFAAMSTISSWRRTLASTVAVVALAVACGTSGRELREPNRDAVAPTRSTSAPTSSTFPPTTLQLVAEGFEPGSAIPQPNSCGGQAPGLRWSGVPTGTVELAVGLVDFDEEDAAKRIHWLVAGIPPGGREGTLPPGGATPPGAVTLANGQDGRPAYAAPCISGSRHTFNFVVFALSAPSGLTAESPVADAYSQLESIAQGNIAYYTGTAPN
jgi:phosphatidylethanolamine-binding protein (PEBP) family uncharacterized protein